MFLHVRNLYMFQNQPTSIHNVLLRLVVSAFTIFSISFHPLFRLFFSRFRQASRGPKTMWFPYMDLTFTPFSASSKTPPLQTFLPLPHTRTLSLSKTQKTCYGFWCLHSPATLLTFFQAGYRQIPPREPYPSFFLSESSRASTQYFAVATIDTEVLC